MVHDPVAKSEEFLVRQRLGKEIRQIFVSRHEGHHELQVLDALANEQMPAFDMFHRHQELPLLADVSPYLDPLLMA